MNRLRAIVIGASFGLSALALQAQDSKPFSQVVTPQEYDAAGLAKLSPAERAALDQLFEKYRSGAVAEAAAANERAQAAEQREQAAKAAQQAAQTAAEERARAAEEAERTAKLAADAAKQQAADAEAKAKASGNFISRAEALIAPGTRIKYTTIDAHIVGTIKGWEAKSVFLLDNGQQWQVSDYSDYFNVKAVENPKVSIKPARIAGFEMHIEGMGYLRVKLISGPIYKEEK